MLEVLEMEQFDRAELLSSLRRTRLRDGAPLYEQAELELRPATHSDLLAPAQRYVLTPGIDKILELRAAVLEHGVDIFALDGGIRVRSSERPGEWIPVIPPVVEESVERDGRTVLVIADGIHRVYAARSIGMPISVVAVYGVAPEHAYYAWALDAGWDDVRSLTELPDGFQKKEYRRPENYKSLFRDYNAVFPGVQEQRKRSNPAHLVA